VELNVTDKNGDAITLSVVSGSADGVAVDSATGIVSYVNVSDTQPFTIKVSASDGKVSTIWEPKIKYCACQVIMFSLLQHVCIFSILVFSR